VSVLNRYFLRQLATAFVIVLIVLTALVWFSQALRLLNLVIEKGRSLTEFLELTGLLVPWLSGLIAPSALFIASIYVLDRMNGDSELVVMHASGVSRWRLLVPFAVAATLVTIFIGFINAYAMPVGMREFRHKLREVRTDLIATLVQEGQFVTPEAGLTVHIKEVAPNGDLVGLLFHDQRDPAASVTYLARRARLLRTEHSAVLQLRDGTVQRRRPSVNAVDHVRFDEYALDLASFATPPDADYYEPPERFLSELFDPALDDTYAKSYPGKIRAEAHDRLSNPLYAFAMMLIAFAGMSDARTTRQNRIVVVLTVIAVAIAVRIAGATTVNMLVRDPGLAPMPYAVPLATIAASLAIVMLQSRRGLGRLRGSARGGTAVPAGAAGWAR